MVRQFSFLAAVFSALGGIAWWSNQVEISGAAFGVGQARSNPASDAYLRRQELLETLDRMVDYQHYYRKIYRRFTQVTRKTGYSVPQSVAGMYEIRVNDATDTRLLITAFSEAEGKLGDVITIDQDYRIHANFQIPSLRAEYLKAQALKHLRQLRENSVAAEDHPRGLFQSYFHFEVMKDSRGELTAFCRGIRPPVLSLQLELNSANPVAASEASDANAGWENLAAASGERVGQKTFFEEVELGVSEQARLAQTIFRGEVGRYARDWSELSKIASFGVDERLRADAQLQIEASDESGEDGSRAPAASGTTQSESGLVVEPLAEPPKSGRKRPRVPQPN